MPAIINPPNIVTGPDLGLPPQTNIFDATTGSLQLTIQTFRGDFTNGVRVALGDVTGDGIPDIIAGAGTGSGPRVRIYD
ncbi:FG-GAP repeat protein, partial [Vibrio parahaemolyticus]|uniref:FG-GAP repeat protein n=1 Tax=Vibrio parahaemolyticus TaxID=670 RepID=UPI002111D360|nr:hypothetical protein [Vibrio parahaemolyticus]